MALLAVFCLNITGVSAANTDIQRASKDIIMSKVKLEKARNGKKYVEQLNAVTKKFSGNEKKLKELSSNIRNAQYKLMYKKSSKAKKMMLILNYLDAKVNYELLKIEAQADKELEKTLETVKNPDISSSDLKKVEAEIVKIQSNLFENSVKNIETLTKEFEKLSNYENKGDIKMNLNIDQDQIWKVKAELQLKDYTAKNSNFNSQLKGHISALIDAAPKNRDAFKLEFTNFLDFIQKDGNMYVLINDLNIVSEENVDELQEFITQAKKIAEENEYIKFSDKQTEEAMKLLESFAPQKILSDGKVYFSKPFFTPYKKEGNKYYLVPSKYACDTAKEFMNKFDPIHGKTCSTSQYNDLVKDILKNWDLTLEIGKINTLSYNFNTKNLSDIEKMNGSIAFSDSYIESVDMLILPNQKTLKNEKFTLNYSRNSELNAYLYAKKWEVKYTFNSTLDRNNKFEKITYNGKSATVYQDFVSNFNLSNSKFTGNFDVFTKSFNTTSNQYRNEFKSNIEWELDRNNDIENFSLTYHQTDLQNNVKKLEWEISYKNNIITVKNNVTSKNKYTQSSTDSELLFTGKWDSNNKNFKNFDFDFFINKDNKFDIVKSDISLVDGKITWSTVIASEEEYITKITTQWTYVKDSIVLNNTIDIQPKLLKMFDSETMQSSIRDSSRFSDLYEIQDEIKAYADKNNGKLPTIKALQERVDFLPKDDKGGKEINGCKFGYTYQVNSELDTYKLSSCREKESYDGKMVMTIWNYRSYNPVTYKLEEKTITGETYYIHGYNNWEKVTTTSEWIKSAIGKYNISYDGRWNKDNSNIYIDFKVNDKTIVDFELDIKSTTEYKETNIEAPKSSKNFDEILK